MSILNAARAIDRFMIDHNYYEISQEYIDGENVETYPVSGTRKMAGFQMTAESLKYLPEGAYNGQDFKFYDKEIDALIPERSIIERANGDRFRVKDISDRTFEGGFNAYLTKKIQVNDGSTD
jgi:hypothetical protein